MAEKLWIQDAVKHPGALRASAKRRGMIKGDEKLSNDDLETLANSDDEETARRARLAQTFRKMRKS